MLPSTVIATGCARHYQETGDLNSRDAALLLDPIWTPSWLLRMEPMPDSNREVAFELLNVLERLRLGETVIPLEAEACASYGLQCIDEWCLPAPRPWGLYVRPFMVGLTMESLIAYWTHYQGNTDTTPIGSYPGSSANYSNRAQILAAIPAKIKQMCDWLWNNCWLINSTWEPGGFMYTDKVVSTTMVPFYSYVAYSGATNTVFRGPSSLGSTSYQFAQVQFTSGPAADGSPYDIIAYNTTNQTFTLATAECPAHAPNNGDTFEIYSSAYPPSGPTGDNGISADVSYLIGPAYAWYYWYTSSVLGSPNVTYRDQHDAIFDGGIIAWQNPYSLKVYNQCYRWSYDGLKWRSRGDSEWTAATTYTLTVPSPASGQANAPSGAFVVELPANTSVASPVTITPVSSTGRGTFIAIPIMTTVQPIGMFRFIPDPADTGTNVTITTTNSGGLNDPVGVIYTVGTVATIATGHTVTGPSSGSVGVAATFTLQTVPTGSVMPVSWYATTGGLDCVYPSDGATGQFNNGPPAYPGPSTKLWMSAERSGTFTYTAATSGTFSLTFTYDTLGISNIGPNTFVAS